MGGGIPERRTYVVASPHAAGERRTSSQIQKSFASGGCHPSSSNKKKKTRRKEDALNSFSNHGKEESSLPQPSDLKKSRGTGIIPTSSKL